MTQYTLPTLPELRQQIDSIDEQIHQLINQRAICAQQVAEVKHAEDPSIKSFYRPEREAQVLQMVISRQEQFKEQQKLQQRDTLHGETIARLFREIMSACLALESPLNIAFLGPNGTFTHTAALKHFGHAALTQPLATIDEVFREVDAQSVNYGVVPVENSSEGVVNHTLDCFMGSSLKIVGEVELRIHQNLLVAEGTQIKHISRIYSHQQSLAQCRKWLDAHFPKVERVAVSSNAEAARMVKNEWHSAAIAGETAAELYALTMLHKNIEDNPNNTTRFLIIGTEETAPSGDDKTSLIVAAHNESGALYHILEPFYRHGISLTRIETRPAQNNVWSYVFFIDFEGHQQQPHVKAVLDEIRTRVRELRILGSYPKAVL
ncbi:MAG: prephenate dehydratase [Moraxellaceae bacterium]|jgi:chorismate mutase/prephenate dehydratase|nr:prephenate dehydratase [Moraxellaceae bacterium]MBL0231438.1 prephenate dehydratase [Moraxellaceae bacterium]MCC6373783.1 prephenate dehydratase [Moraxellaceae bacterium]